MLAVDEVLDELDRIPVGPELAAALAELPGPEAAGWDDPHTQARVAGRWAALSTWAEAQSLRQINAGSRTVSAIDDPIYTVGFAADVALTAQQSEWWADRQIELADHLSRRLPVMAHHISHGVLSVRHARELVRVLDTAEDTVATRIDEPVSNRAVEHRWTPSQLAAAARRMLLRLDPDGGADRHDRALDREADVTSGPAADGLAWLAATGDAVSVHEITDAVDARARQLQQLAPDTPTGRARFAALADLVLGNDFTLFDHALGNQVDPVARTGADASQPPTRCRRRELIVTIDLLTLLGLRDNPAEIAGYGPIPPRIARLLADDASLRRMVTDPVTGEVLHLDRRSRVATDLLATAIRAAQQTCQFPGCTRPHRPEVDHRDDWADGGQTEPENLQLLCRRHHALKTAGLWQVDKLRNGTAIWTGPDGQVAMRIPDHDPPDHLDSG